MISCEKAKDYLARQEGRQLSRRSQCALNVHLQCCATCQELGSQLGQILQWLNEWREIEPPTDFKSRFWQKEKLERQNVLYQKIKKALLKQDKAVGFISKDALVIEALKYLAEKGAGAVIVMSAHRPIGIVSKRGLSQCRLVSGSEKVEALMITLATADVDANAPCEVCLSKLIEGSCPLLAEEAMSDYTACVEKMKGGECLYLFYLHRNTPTTKTT